MTNQKKNFIVLALASLALVLMVTLGIQVTDRMNPAAENATGDRQALLSRVFEQNAMANSVTINEPTYTVIVSPLRRSSGASVGTFKGSSSGGVSEHGLFFIDKTSGIILLYSTESAGGRTYRFKLLSFLNINKEMERAQAAFERVKKN